METLVCTINGMHCAACSQKIEKGLNETKGIKSAHINFNKGNATIFYDSSIIDEKKIFKVISKVGYTAVQSGLSLETKTTVLKNIPFTITACVITVILTLAALISQYIPMFTNLFYSEYIAFGVSAIIFGLALTAQLQLKKHYSIILLSLFFTAAGGTFIYYLFNSEFQTELFYNALNFFATLILFIGYLELKDLANSKLYFEKITSLLPQQARLYQHETFVEIETEKLKNGDILLVKQNEVIPADGVVIDGSSKVNEALLNGSKDKIKKEVGDKVYAGTINSQGEIYVKALNVGKNITLKKVIEYNKNTLNNKISVKKYIDKYKKFSEYASIPIAVGLFGGIWFISKDIHFAFKIGAGILVLMNPLFLLFIYQIIFNTAVVESMKRGISLKSGKVLERLAKVNHVIFNKTGIITEGIAEITNVYPKTGYNIKRFLILIGSLERSSTHQFAQAIVSYCKNEKISLMEVFDFKEIEGNGVMGRVDGSEIIAGNFKLMEKSNVTLDKDLLHKADIMAQNLKTPIFVSKNRELVGVIGVGDVLKPSTNVIINKLKAYPKLKLSLITGDNKKITEEIGKELRLHSVIADMRPKDKIEAITNKQEQGEKVAFVGDGITDAEILKKSNIGISVSAGSDYDLKTSDVTIIDDDLLKIDKVLKMSKAATKKMNFNKIMMIGGASLIVLTNIIFYIFTKNIFPPHLTITLYLLILIVIEFNNHSFKTVAYSIS